MSQDQIIKFKPTSAGRRKLALISFGATIEKPKTRKLLKTKASCSGRNNSGRVTVRARGGGGRKHIRIIDDVSRRDLECFIEAFEYDPNRTSLLARLCSKDGQRFYCLSWVGANVGDIVSAGSSVDIKNGNSMPLSRIPLGSEIFNIELKPCKGGQLVKSAGSKAQLVAKDSGYCLVKLPSGGFRRVLESCYATLGAVSNPLHSNVTLGKAGRARWKGIRPLTRGVAKNPVDHPMGGGEGKSAGGRHPTSANGVLSKGFKTRKCRRTDKFVVSRNRR